MAVFRINGVDMPMPSRVSMKYADLSSEDSGRDLAGTMHKDIVARKRTLDCEWSGLSMADGALLLTAIKSAATMSVTCYDHYVGEEATWTAYTGDCDVEPYNYALGIIERMVCSFIEV